MPILSFESIVEIQVAALGYYAEPGGRERLLRFIAPEVLPASVASHIRDRLMDDLTALNEIPNVIGDTIPLEQWLKNAHWAHVTSSQKQALFRERADDVRRKVNAPPPAGSQKAKAGAIAADLEEAVKEKILWVNDLLPLSFLDGAVRTASAVARIKVPRYQGAAAAVSPSSGLPINYYGTGWLIGERHLITNHHVVNARSAGEPDASNEEFVDQASNAVVEFDYDDGGRETTPYKVEAVCARDARLDFAVLRIAPVDGRDKRPPLLLADAPVLIDTNSYLAVNIIQHPGGQPKQLAIRNNLAAQIEGTDLAYFTDTEAGSSGSPVCNDQWRVIALHKASTPHLGSFTYQGRDTTWVNIGTPISLIVDALKGEKQLWSEIGARVL